jgi:flagellar basal-body rod protein FlgB
VANADVPDYAPRDMKPFTFDQQLAGVQTGPTVSLARTSPAHLDMPDGPPSVGGDTDAPDSEVRLDGNHVVLEEQMVKMNEAQGDYAAAVSFYEQSLSLLKMAAAKPGG